MRRAAKMVDARHPSASSLRKTAFLLEQGFARPKMLRSAALLRATRTLIACCSTSSWCGYAPTFPASTPLQKAAFPRL